MKQILKPRFNLQRALKEIGVPDEEWMGWMRDPGFGRWLREHEREARKTMLPAVHGKLLDAALDDERKDQIAAQKLYMERFDDEYQSKEQADLAIERIALLKTLLATSADPPVVKQIIGGPVVEGEFKHVGDPLPSESMYPTEVETGEVRKVVEVEDEDAGI